MWTKCAFRNTCRCSSFILNLRKYQQIQSEGGIDWVRCRLCMFYFSMFLQVKNCGYLILFQWTLCRVYCLNLGVFYSCLLSETIYLLWPHLQAKILYVLFSVKLFLAASQLLIFCIWIDEGVHGPVCHLTADACFLREQGWVGLEQPLGCANRKADGPKELLTDPSLF